ncbi:MAG: ComEC/Rec2 family competence protein [Pseudomonadota bacterium]
MARRIDLDRDRLFLWLPVCFGVGIGTYFAQRTEPTLWTACLIAVAAVLGAWLVRHRTLMFPIATACAVAALGFAAASIRTAVVAAPVLAMDLRAATVSGTIVDITERARGGPRLILAPTTIAGVPDARRPARVSIRLLRRPKPGEALLAIGDHVSVRATLSPPPRPAIPGGYDFARDHYFKQIGASGFAIGAPKHTPLPHGTAPSWWLEQRAQIARVRHTIATHIRTLLTGDTGAIAAALITGDRGAISDATRQAYRDAGIAHVLVISGLHMALLASAIFMAVRVLLALVPPIALRMQTKKAAAVIAALAATGYLLISGAGVATTRAYIMILIMLIAILSDRPALSMRNVAIAALSILAITPESLLNIGFQMSFAAVVALVAVYEAVIDRRRSQPPDIPRGAFMRGVLGVGAILATTLICSVAIAPIAAFHFNHGQLLALVTNLVAVPLMNFAIMPLVIVTAIAAPLGFEAFALAPMGLAIDTMTAAARWVAGLPGATVAVPAMTHTAFVLMVVGGLWLCLWRSRLRLWGTVVCLLGLAVAPLGHAPHVLIGNDGKLIAYRGDDGRLAALGSGGSFQLGMWLRARGDRRDARAVLKESSARCDERGCVGTVEGIQLAVARHPSALVDDCRTAAIVVATFSVPQPCSGPLWSIDRSRIRDWGTHAVYLASAPPTGLGRLWSLSGIGRSDGGVASDLTGRDGVAAGRTARWLQDNERRGANGDALRVAVVTVDGARGLRPWVVQPATRRRAWAEWRAARKAKRAVERVVKRRMGDGTGAAEGAVRRFAMPQLLPQRLQPVWGADEQR